jgi:predicted dithiol-disulfide oxidoreductase (DUF899 family)
MTKKPREDEEIDRLEYQIEELKRQVARLRRTRQREVVRDYALRDRNGVEVHLSDLFGDRAELILVHNMGTHCSYCTMWADGFVGLHPHLTSRAAFAVTSPDEPDVQQRFAGSRGWSFPMYSAAGTSFVEDLGFVSDDGYMPGVSAFVKEPDGTIVRVARAEFAPGDDFCPVWHFFDLLPKGADGWEPKLSY